MREGKYKQCYLVGKGQRRSHRPWSLSLLLQRGAWVHSSWYKSARVSKAKALHIAAGRVVKSLCLGKMVRGVLGLHGFQACGQMSPWHCRATGQQCPPQTNTLQSNSGLEVEQRGKKQLDLTEILKYRIYIRARRSIQQRDREVFFFEKAVPFLCKGIWTAHKIICS